MATKRTIIDIRAQGGDNAERDLRKVGAAGEDMGRKLDRGSKEASRGLKAIDAAVANTRGTMSRLAASLGPVGAGLRSLGVAGLAAAGGVVGGGGLFLLTKRALENADALAKQAQAADISTDTFQEFAFAAGQVGLKTEEVASSFTKFAKRIGDFNTTGSGPLVNFLDKFDQSLANNIRSAGSTEEALELVINRLTSLSSAADRASLADAAFSESGRKLGIQLARNADALAANRERAHELGLVIQSSLIAEAEIASDRFDELRQILSTNINRALLQLAPVIENLGIAFGNAAPRIAEFVNSFLDLEDLGAAALNQRLIVLLKELDQAEAQQAAGRGRNRRGTNERITTLKAEIDQIEALLKLRQAESEQARIASESREELSRNEQAARKALEAQTAKDAADQRKNDAERKKALTELAAAEEKAARAGLSQIQVLERERDQAVRRQAERLTQQIITAEEFARFRIALFKSTEEEISDIHKEEADKRAELAAKEAEKAAEALQKPFDNFVDHTQAAFADLFTEALQGDVKNFEDFFGTIKQLAARTAGEMAALFVFSPQLFFGAQGGLAAAAAGTAPGLSSIGGGLASLGGGLLPAAGFSPLATLGLAGLGGGAIGFGLTGSLAGGLGGAAGGAGGFYAGLLYGSALGPIGAIGGGILGALGGSLLGDRLFGGGSENKSRFGFTSTTGRGIPTPFGGISLHESQNIDAAGIARLLVSIDESINRLLTPEQRGAVSTALVGTSDFFSAGKVDNEIFDTVRNRLVNIIDAAVGNSVASQILNEVPRGNENIEQLVTSAEQIIALVREFNEEAPTTQAEQAIRALNDQFDELARQAERLGLSVEIAEQRRSDAIRKLTTDFDASVQQQILGFTDPLTATLDQLTIAQEQRLREAEVLGADLVQLEHLNALERKAAIEQAFGGANQSITAFLDSLRLTGAGGLSLAQQTSNASARFDELLGLARTDPAARADLASLLPTFLNLKREELGSTPAFFEFTSFLDSTLRNLVDQTDTVSTLNDIGAAITAGDNAVIDALEETNKRLIAEVSELRADINLLLNARAIA